MWFLNRIVGNTRAQVRILARFRPNESYVVNPKGSQDKSSIVKFRVLGFAEEDVVGSRSRPDVILQRNGLSVMVDGHVVTEDEYYLHDQQIIHIGKSRTAYILKWEPVSIYHNKAVNPEAHKKLIQRGQELGIYVIHSIRSSYDKPTHYCISVNPSVYQLSKITCDALAANNVYFIRPDWVDQLLRVGDQHFDLKPFNDKIEPITVDRFEKLDSTAILGPDPRRKQLFKGMDFWFFDQQQFNRFKDMIKRMGGKAQLKTFEQVLNSDTEEGSPLFVAPPNADMFPDWLHVHTKYCHDNGVERVLIEPEIRFALVFCSTNIMCNPASFPWERMEPNSLAYASFQSASLHPMSVKQESLDPTMPVTCPQGDDHNYHQHRQQQQHSDDSDDNDDLVQAKPEPVESTVHSSVRSQHAEQQQAHEEEEHEHRSGVVKEEVTEQDQEMEEAHQEPTSQQQQQQQQQHQQEEEEDSDDLADTVPVSMSPQQQRSPAFVAPSSPAFVAPSSPAFVAPSSPAVVATSLPQQHSSPAFAAVSSPASPPAPPAASPTASPPAANQVPEEAVPTNHSPRMPPSSSASISLHVEPANPIPASMDFDMDVDDFLGDAFENLNTQKKKEKEKKIQEEQEAARRRQAEEQRTQENRRQAEERQQLLQRQIARERAEFEAQVQGRVDYNAGRGGSSSAGRVHRDAAMREQDEHDSEQEGQDEEEPPLEEHEDQEAPEQDDRSSSSSNAAAAVPTEGHQEDAPLDYQHDPTVLGVVEPNPEHGQFSRIIYRNLEVNPRPPPPTNGVVNYKKFKKVKQFENYSSFDHSQVFTAPTSASSSQNNTTRRRTRDIFTDMDPGTLVPEDPDIAIRVNRPRLR
ncbi:hypothetical protein MBANPS3_001052 [Mucor bainieri]